MSQPFDPTLIALVETVPEDWPVLVGQPRGPTEVVEGDLGTVQRAADKVLRVWAAVPYLLHLEFLAGHAGAQQPPLLDLRNLLLEVRHGWPVRTVAVLLRPEADAPALTGVRRRAVPGEKPYGSFRYQVLRVWQLPVETLLAGGLGTLPLAPISAVTAADLPGIIEKMRQRLSRREARAQAANLWGATYILLGMRYSSQVASLLLRGVLSMRESTTYQAILEEGAAIGEAKGKAEGEAKGRLAEARKFLQMLGEGKFGIPDGRAAKALAGIDDLQRLETLGRRLLQASSWQELLELPPRRRRSRE